MLKSGFRAIVNKQFKKKKLCHFYGKLENHQGVLGNCFFSPILCFQKQFSVFETKKLVWQPKIDRKQKSFSKLNL